MENENIISTDLIFVKINNIVTRYIITVNGQELIMPMTEKQRLRIINCERKEPYDTTR